MLAWSLADSPDLRSVIITCAVKLPVQRQTPHILYFSITPTGGWFDAPLSSVGLSSDRAPTSPCCNFPTKMLTWCK